MTDGGSQRNALITGDANGFGLAMVAALLKRGDLVIIADIDCQQLDAAYAALPQVGLHSMELDVTRPASVRDAVDAQLTTHGSLDCLVNCAGRWVPPAQLRTRSNRQRPPASLLDATPPRKTSCKQSSAS